MIVVVGLSHKTAPITVRERLAIGRDEVPNVLGRLVSKGPIGEAVILSTCNRVEIYAAARGRSASPADIEQVVRTATAVLTEIGGSGIAAHLKSATGTDAVLHLFQVAASLD